VVRSRVHGRLAVTDKLRYRLDGPCSRTRKRGPLIGVALCRPSQGTRIPTKSIAAQLFNMACQSGRR